MTRFLIFAAAGPPVGLVMFFLLAPLLTTMRFDVSDVLHAIFLLPRAYMFGIVPALVTAACDWVFSLWIGGWPRVIATACVGALAGAGLVTLALLSFGRPNYEVLLLFATMGAVAGATCSWLSARYR